MRRLLDLHPRTIIVVLVCALVLVSNLLEAARQYRVEHPPSPRVEHYLCLPVPW